MLPSVYFLPPTTACPILHFLRFLSGFSTPKAQTFIQQRNVRSGYLNDSTIILSCFQKLQQNRFQTAATDELVFKISFASLLPRVNAAFLSKMVCTIVGASTDTHALINGRFGVLQNQHEAQYSIPQDTSHSTSVFPATRIYHQLAPVVSIRCLSNLRPYQM